MTHVRKVPGAATSFPAPRWVNAAVFSRSDSRHLNGGSGFATAAPIRQTLEFSAWVRPAALVSNATSLFVRYLLARSGFVIHFDSALALRVVDGSHYKHFGQHLRDGGDFGHLWVGIDTRLADAALRIRAAWNGAEILRTVGVNNPSLNYALNGTSSGGWTIGSSFAGGDYFDGLLGDLRFEIGHSALHGWDAFGEFIQGSWVPRGLNDRPAFTSHAFHHLYDNAADMTEDSSGNGYGGNNNNGVFQAKDNPMDACCQLQLDVPNNPPNNGASMTMYRTARDAGTHIRHTGTTRYMTIGTMMLPSDQSWMFEVTRLSATTTYHFGFTHPRMFDNSDRSLYPYFYASLANHTVTGGGPGQQGTLIAASGSVVDGDTVAVGWDAGTNEVVLVRKDDTVARAAFPGDVPDYWMSFVWCDPAGVSALRTFDVNFGRKAAVRTWPAGMLECRKGNLAEPSVRFPRENATTRLRQGTGVDTDIVLPFDDGLSWVRRNGAAGWHYVVDDVRGTGPNGQQLAIYPNSTGGQQEISTDGSSDYRIQAPGRRVIGSPPDLNANGAWYHDWHFRHAPELGIAVLEVDCTGNFMTIPHGLGLDVGQGMVWGKKLESAGNWHIYHRWIRDSLTEACQYWLRLNLPNSQSGPVAGQGGPWGGTPPDATNVYLGTDAALNAAGEKTLLVCMAPVRGFSHFWFHYGNGSGGADAPVYPLPFVPDVWMTKCASINQDWGISSRAFDPVNEMDKSMNIDSVTTSYAGHYINFVHGIRLNGVQTRYNSNGQRYIDMALARDPAKYARAA